MSLAHRLTRRKLLALAGTTAAVYAVGCSPAPQPTATTAPAAAPATTAPAAAKAPAQTSTQGDRVIAELGPYIARTGAKGELIFSNCWGGARIPLMEAQFKDFNTYYPNIKLQNDVATCPDLEKKHLTGIAGGNPADVIMLQSNLMPSFVEQNALQPLDEFLARDELKADEIFYPGEIGTHRYKGKTYSMPNVTAGAWHFIWWHKALMKQAGLDPDKGPDNWDDLNKMADAVKSKIPDVYFLEPSHAFSHPTFLVFLYNNGGEYMSQDMRKITFNSPEGLQTLEWMVQFGKRQARGGKFEELADRTTSVKDNIAVNVRVSGKYAAFISGSWSWFEVKAAAPDKEFALTNFPYNASNSKAKRQTPVHGGWGFCIPRGVSKERAEAAWEWIKYATAGEGNRKFTKAQNRPSPAKKYNDDPDLKAGNPYWSSVVVKDFELNVPIPVTPVHPQILDVLWNMQEEAFFEKATPKQALDKGAAGAQKILDEWYAKQK